MHCVARLAFTLHSRPASAEHDAELQRNAGRTVSTNQPARGAGREGTFFLVLRYSISAVICAAHTSLCTDPRSRGGR